MSSSNGTQKSNIINPDFVNERETVVVQHTEQTFMDVPHFGRKVNVLLLSYNRPRMINDAIKSVIEQDYLNMCLWILDDGSDFDLLKVVERYIDHRQIILQVTDPISIDKRIKKSRVAQNINTALNNIPQFEYITYLCDDDIMAPNWIRRAALALDANPDYHVANGQLFWFNDGEHWKVDAKYGMPGFDNAKTAWYSTGSLMHRSDCYWTEKLEWHDNELGHSQDVVFLGDVFNTHPNSLILDCPANFRREHDKTLSSKLGRKDEKGNYILDFIPGEITEDMVSGMME